MTQRLRHIFSLIFLLPVLFSPIISAAPQASLKVSLDSAFVLMGKATPLHIELVDNEDSKGELIIPADTFCDKVEILRILPADTSSIGSGRREIKQEILLQSFDSGTYRLNSVLYISGVDTLAPTVRYLRSCPP